MSRILKPLPFRRDITCSTSPQTNATAMTTLGADFVRVYNHDLTNLAYAVISSTASAVNGGLDTSVLGAPVPQGGFIDIGLTDCNATVYCNAWGEAGTPVVSFQPSML